MTPTILVRVEAEVAMAVIVGVTSTLWLLWLAAVIVLPDLSDTSFGWSTLDGRLLGVERDGVGAGDQQESSQ